MLSRLLSPRASQLVTFETIVHAWLYIQIQRTADKVCCTPERPFQLDDILLLARSCPQIRILGLPLQIEYTATHMPIVQEPPPPLFEKLCIVEVSPEFTEDTVRLFVSGSQISTRKQMILWRSCMMGRWSRALPLSSREWEVNLIWLWGPQDPMGT